MAKNSLIHCSGCSCHFQRPLMDLKDSPPSYDQAIQRTPQHPRGTCPSPQARNTPTETRSAVPESSQSRPKRYDLWKPIYHEETSLEKQKRHDIYRSWRAYILSRQHGHIARFLMKLKLCEYALKYGKINSMSMDRTLLQHDPEHQALTFRSGSGEICLLHDSIYCYCILVDDGGTVYEYNAKSAVLEEVFNVPRGVGRLDVRGAAKGDRCPEHGRRGCYCVMMKDERTGRIMGTDIKSKVFGARWNFTNTHEYSEVDGWVPRAVLP